MVNTVMTDNAFRAKDIGLRAQKKILSRMASKNVAKVFIDETTSSLLDNVYRLTKHQLGSKKEAEKLVKNIIKIVIKLAILHKNEVFTEDETQKTNTFYQKFTKLQMSIISFFEVEFSFDLIYLQKLITEVHQLLKEIVSSHLSDKSLLKIDEIFESLNNPQFLESIFKADSPHRDLMEKIVSDLNKVMEQNE
ncbi:CLUMA_CG015005, isoform A [Clunio marinus]|uniref:CLUMA_CG015005, isoform A n=1 Tax=Clunio marinus TaxID=568069 RepID=A0A1J1INI3_9DIPT|nr:CLUMA_CG015005, isoform A [Clunio marinus]